MSNPICAHCGLKMERVKSGVAILEEYQSPPEPYALWMADLFECSLCKNRVIADRALNPLARNHEQNFPTILEKTEAGMKANGQPIFLWHENKASASASLRFEALKERLVSLVRLLSTNEGAPVIHSGPDVTEVIEAEGDNLVIKPFKDDLAIYADEAGGSMKRVLLVGDAWSRAIAYLIAVDLVAQMIESRHAERGDANLQFWLTKGGSK